MTKLALLKFRSSRIFETIIALLIKTFKPQKNRTYPTEKVSEYTFSNTQCRSLIVKALSSAQT